MKRFLLSFLLLAVSYSVSQGGGTESVSVKSATGIVQNQKVIYPTGVLNDGKLDAFNDATTFFKTLALSSSAASFKTLLALQNVDNTSDANKPLSIAQQAYIDNALVNIGPGGGGSGLTALSLLTPSTFFDDVTFNFSGTTASGSLVLKNAPAGSVMGNATGSAAQPGYIGVSGLRTLLGISNIDNTSDANKPISDATQTALDAKAGASATTSALSTLTTNVTTLQSHDTTNTAAISDLVTDIGTNTSDIASLTTAVGTKASSASLTSGLALKEDLLPTSGNDGFVLVRDADGTFRYVDPVTLGSTSATYTDGHENSNTTFTSASAIFVSGDIGKTIIGDDIPDGTTIASVTNTTTVVLSQAATATATITFTIVNRYLPTSSSGTVTSFAATNNISTLFSTSVGNSTTTPLLTFNPTTPAANTFYGNGTGSAAAATFMNAGTARTAMGGTTVGQSLFTLTNPSAIRFLKINADNTVTAETGANHINSMGAEFALGAPSSINGQVLASSIIGARSWVSKEDPLTFSSPLSRSTNTISIPNATGSVTGALSSTDWTTFNSKESALTFSTPLTRSTNTISLAAASSSVNGYLTSTDWAIFNAKVPTSRQLTGTDPITIDLGTGADLSTNRAIGIKTASTSQTGAISSTDWNTFNNKVSTTRTISTTAPLAGGGALSGNLTLSLPAAAAGQSGYLSSTDWPIFTKDVTQTGGNANATWTNGVTDFTENTPLTANRNRTLPATTSYVDGATIRYIDNVTTANVGPLFFPGTGDTLKGSSVATWTTAGGYQPFTAGANGGKSKSITFEKFGTDWRVYSLGGETLFATSIQNPSTLAGVATFNSADLTSGRSIYIPDANSTYVVPSDTSTAGFVKDITSLGVVNKADPHPADVVPVEDSVGAQGFTFGSSFHNVDNSSPGVIDTVRIAGGLQNPVQLNWPNASNFPSGYKIDLLDASGTVTQANPVTVVATNGTDTFAGQSSFVFTETRGRKTFTSDGNSEWSVSATKTAIQTFAVSAGPNLLIATDPNSGVQHAHFNLTSGVNNLTITGPTDGMQYEIVLVQPSSGSAASIALPTGSRTASNGLGLVTLSTTNNRIDRLKGVYDGVINAFLWDPLITEETSAALPAAPSALSATGINANRVDLAWTDNASNEDGFVIERADGLSQTTGFAQVSPGTAAVNATSYIDLTVLGSHDYTYRVKAKNTGGTSAASGTANVSTAAGGPTADLLEWHLNDGGSSTTASATIGPNGTVPVPNWTTSTQSGTGAAFAPVVGMVATAGQTITNAGTAGTSTYTYRVVAFKNGGSHNGPAPVTTTTGSTTGGLTGANYNHITWTAVSGADYYKVFRTAVSGGGSPTTLGVLAGTGAGFTATSFDDTGVGTVGPALTDYGTTDTNNVTAQSVVTYGQAITVAFWEKAAFAGSTQTTIIGGANSTSSFRIMQVGGNKFQVTYPRASGTQTGTVPNNVTSNGSAINDNAHWHLVVVVMDTTAATGQETKVYYDGNNPQTVTPVGTQGTGAQAIPAGATSIGAPTFTGNLDDVRVYNRALNTTEIAALFVGNAQ